MTEFLEDSASVRPPITWAFIVDEKRDATTHSLSHLGDREAITG